MVEDFNQVSPIVARATTRVRRMRVTARHRDEMTRGFASYLNEGRIMPRSEKESRMRRFAQLSGLCLILLSVSCGGRGDTMDRPPEIAQIEATLGRSFSKMRSVANASAFYVLLPLDSNSQAATELIEKHCVQWHARGYTVFVGYVEGDANHGIFALPNINPVRLMESFHVGGHNDLLGDTPVRAARYMGELYKTEAFVPYFVDSAGFKVTFINHVSAARAEEIEHAIVEFDPEAYDLTNHETILAHQRVELWWD
jgi:hypothetical protein